MLEDGTLKSKKKEVTRKECKRLREEFEVGDFMAQKGLRNIAKKRMLEDTGALPRETCSVNTNPCTKKTFSVAGCGRMWTVKKKKKGEDEQVSQRRGK